MQGKPNFLGNVAFLPGTEEGARFFHTLFIADRKFYVQEYRTDKITQIMESFLQLLPHKQCSSSYICTGRGSKREIVGEKSTYMLQDFITMSQPDLLLYRQRNSLLYS